MSDNPNHDANSGYGNPPYGMPPQGPYGPPQGPYGPPPQGPYGVPPYGQPQSPYGAQPYGYPPQGPYGVPPFQQPGYGYATPPAAPLPLGEAIRQLPSQYFRVLTKPSAATFAEEMGKAAWNIVWVQLLGLGVIFGVLVFLIFQLALPGVLNNLSSSNSPAAGMVAIIEGAAVAFAIGEIILLPLGFFINEGIYYLIAKAFGGQGTFLAQSYGTLLFYIPLNIVGVLSLIPFLGILIGIALAIYQIVLNIYMMMAVHRLSGGKATLVLFTPVIVVFVLACIIGIIAVAIGSHSHP